MSAPKRRRIDQTTKDYVLERGEHAEDVGCISQVLHSLHTKQGSVPMLPWYGSRLHTIQKGTAIAAKLGEDYVHEALAHLVRRGDVRKLEAKVTITKLASGARMDVEVSYIDRARQPQAVRTSSTLGR